MSESGSCNRNALMSVVLERHVFSLRSPLRPRWVPESNLGRLPPQYAHAPLEEACSSRTPPPRFDGLRRCGNIRWAGATQGELILVQNFFEELKAGVGN